MLGLRCSMVLLLASTVCFAQRTSPTIQPQPSYGQLPLTFEANQGQMNPQAKFLSRGKGYTAVLTAGGVMLSIRPTENSDPRSGQTPVTGQSNRPLNTTLQFTLVGAAANPVVMGEGLQPGRVNYFIGNDRSKWRTNIPTYVRVRYKNVYPGIDLLYYGNHRQLEYDFVVSPGADPSHICFEIKGANGIEIDQKGDLVLKTGSGELHFQSPSVYQESKGSRVPLPGGYVLKGPTSVAFRVGNFDRNRPLVIDPVLLYSTYLGGDGNDQSTGIAVDNSGCVYVTGYTDSTNFPLATLGSLPPGSDHVFVAKFDATGSNLVYADYLGGDGQDYGYAITLDSANDAYIAGSTASSNFPTVNAFQPSYPGGFNAFVTKISDDGSSLLYSTYLGGNSSDVPSSIALDGLSEIFVAGSTSSTNFPVANAYQSTASPNQGGMYGTYGFLTKFTPDGSSLAYSTYFAGSSNVPLNCGGSPCWPGPTSVINGMAVDAAGDAYVAGSTNTYNFPVTSGAYLTTNSTQADALVGFVSKFNISGSPLYSTYFYDPSSFTAIQAIAVDGAGSAYVAGHAFSDRTFPITSTSICDPSVSGTACSFAFVTKFDATASTLVYSTFLGPNNYGIPSAIALDANNDAYVVASTSSNTFGTVNGIEAYAGGSDVLLAEIDPVAGSELFATYLGGNTDESSAGMVVDASGNIYVTGTTDSPDFPTTQGAFQLQLGGNTDAFVMKIGAASAPAVSLSPWSLQYAAQSAGSTSQPQQLLLRNMGSSALTIASISTSGDFAQVDNCGPTVPPSGSCSLSVTFTPTGVGLRTGSVSINDDAAGSPHTVSLTGTGTGAVALLTPASLSFPNAPVGVSSGSQSVSLSSAGDANLNVSNIAVTGDFTQTNNCPGVLPPNSGCTFNLIFTPTVAGSRSGTLTITDDAFGSPQAVSLSGAGLDFTLASSPLSNTVKSGATATYTLTVTPVGGAFTNQIKLSCAGAPAHSTCSNSPASVTPGSKPVSVSLTITTTSSSAAALPPIPGQQRPVYAVWMGVQGLGVLGLLVMKSNRRRKHCPALVVLSLLISSLLFMPACAGGTGIVPQGQGTAPGTYTITVTAASGTLQHTLPLTLVVH